MTLTQYLNSNKNKMYMAIFYDSSCILQESAKKFLDKHSMRNFSLSDRFPIVYIVTTKVLNDFIRFRKKTIISDGVMTHHNVNGLGMAITVIDFPEFHICDLASLEERISTELKIVNNRIHKDIERSNDLIDKFHDITKFL